MHGFIFLEQFYGDIFYKRSPIESITLRPQQTTSLHSPQLRRELYPQQDTRAHVHT